MRVRAAGDAGVQRDPAGVTAHDLDDQHAVVRLGRRVQPVDRLRGDVDRGVEAERVVGGRRGRCRSSSGRRRRGRRGRASWVATPRVSSPPIAMSASTPSVGEVGLDAVDAALDLDRVGAARAEDRAAARQDAAHLRDAERRGDALERALPAVAEADELVAVLLHALADDGTDDGVETGAVAAAGQHSDAHGSPHGVGNREGQARLSLSKPESYPTAPVGRGRSASPERAGRRAPGAACAGPAPRASVRARRSRDHRRYSPPVSILAIDAGTTGVTALVIGTDATVAGPRLLASSPSTSRPRDGWSTTRNEIWAATLDRGPRRARGRSATATRRPRSASPTSARPSCSGTARPSARRAGRSCGRTGVRRDSATSCARTATSRASPRSPACASTPTSPPRSSPGSRSTSRTCGRR